MVIVPNSIISSSSKSKSCIVFVKIFPVSFLPFVPVILTQQASGSLSFFNKNIRIGDIKSNTTQFTKFSSIFADEISRKNNTIIDCKTTGSGTEKISYIIFSSGNQYTFMGKNNAIYKNNVKICQNVDNCDFTYKYVDSKYAITVNFKTDGIDLTGTNAITYNL